MELVSDKWSVKCLDIPHIGASPQDVIRCQDTHIMIITCKKTD